MAKSHCPQSHPILDELISIDVPNSAPAATFNEPRRQLRELVVTLGIGVTTARNQVMALSSKLLTVEKLGNHAVIFSRPIGRRPCPVILARGTVDSPL